MAAILEWCCSVHKGEEVAAAVPVKPGTYSEGVARKAEAVFDMMDTDKSGSIELSEAQAFFKGFGKISAQAMFSAVDEDGNGSLTKDEWVKYFKDLVESGSYDEDELEEELDSLARGEAFCLESRVAATAPSGALERRGSLNKGGAAAIDKPMRRSIAEGGRPSMLGATDAASLAAALQAGEGLKDKKEGKPKLTKKQTADWA